MDSYAVKFQSMQHYVPFLNKMIGKLEKAGDRDKEPQLVKMKSLHGILTDPAKKVRFETLLKCEEVLQKLYEKVEGTGAIGGANISGAWRQPPIKAAPLAADRGGPSDRGPAVSGGFTLSSSLRDAASDLLFIISMNFWHCHLRYVMFSADPSPTVTTD
jgi:hypothetical protein